jgi:inward rectifier potassium channel
MLAPMRPLRYRPPGADYEFHVYGHKSQPLRDFYHVLLQKSWWVTLATIAFAFLLSNAIFGLLFWITGGVKGAHHASDYFFFSVQTMGTIGYGALYPQSPAANALVVAESITGLTLTAVATGLVFAKFSRSHGRIVFSREATVSSYDGKRTLMFRFGNERSNQIIDARLALMMVRTELTAEGHTLYRTYDLELQRHRMLSLSRSWTALHVLDESSPLFDATTESVEKTEVELQVMVVGIDDITMQQVHADHRYFAKDILFGRRHVDILSEEGPTVLRLDLTKFHDTEEAA